MTLQLTNRSRDYYLYEIDSLKSTLNGDISALHETVTTNTTNIDALTAWSNTLADSIGPKQDKTYPAWGDSVKAYWDFADPLNLGKDVSAKGAALTNLNGIEYSEDEDRTHSAVFVPGVSQGWNTPARSTPCLTVENAPVVNSFVENDAFSISLWFNANTGQALPNTRYMLFSMASSQKDSAITFDARSGRSLTLTVKTTANVNTNTYTANAVFEYDTWNHVVVNSSTAGTEIFVNGVSVATGAYTSISTLALDSIAIGAARYYIPTSPPSLRHTQPWWGGISDVIVFNKILTQADINRLGDDDYGYMLVLLGGQSNMVGAAAKVAGVDDVYTKIDGRVFQYNTYDNVTHVNGTPSTVIGSSIVDAVNPLRFPDGAYAGRNSGGLWLTFCNDLIEYCDIAWRRKILLIPIAWGSAGFKSLGGLGNSLLIPGNVVSNTAITATNHAMSLNPMNSIGGFLWSQGENDVNTGNLEYATYFQNMMFTFKTSIPGFDPDVMPVVLNEISQQAYDDVQYQGIHMSARIRNDMIAMCATRPNYRFIYTTDLKNGLGDLPHWDMPSLRKLGTRFFDAFASVLNKSTKPTV